MNKRLFPSTVLLFFFLSMPVWSKPKDQAAEKPVTLDDMVAKMAWQLSLSDQQAIEVKPIIEDYMQKEKQLKLEEKKALGRVLTGQQLYTWNFLQNEAPKQKKKHGL